MGLEGKPGTIVRGKDHDGIFIQSIGFQLSQDLTDPMVYFGNHIPIKSTFALAFKVLGGKKRNMGQIMGQIHKKWLILVIKEMASSVYRLVMVCCSAGLSIILVFRIIGTLK